MHGTMPISHLYNCVLISGILQGNLAVSAFSHFSRSMIWYFCWLQLFDIEIFNAVSTFNVYFRGTFLFSCIYREIHSEYLCYEHVSKHAGKLYGPGSRFWNGDWAVSRGREIQKFGGRSRQAPPRAKSARSLLYSWAQGGVLLPLGDYHSRNQRKHQRLLGMALEEGARGNFARATLCADMVHESNIFAEQLESRLKVSRAILGLGIWVESSAKNFKVGESCQRQRCWPVVSLACIWRRDQSFFWIGSCFIGRFSRRWSACLWLQCNEEKRLSDNEYGAFPWKFVFSVVTGSAVRLLTGHPPTKRRCPIIANSTPTKIYEMFLFSIILCSIFTAEE